MTRAMTALVLLMAGTPSLQAVDETPPADEQFLDALVGKWDMRGTLRGKPVQYHAVGERVLQGGFVRLHMIDAAMPPRYEANLYLGFDAKAGDYVGHWLDRFGAAGARVVATGRRDRNVLVIVFPYAEGKFRDTFMWNAEAGTWSLHLESENKYGAWSTFAKYELRLQAAAQ